MNIINEFFVSFILIKLYFKFKVCRKIKFPLLWKFYFSKWKFYFSADIKAREGYYYDLLNQDYLLTQLMSSEKVANEYRALYEGDNARDQILKNSNEVSVQILSIVLGESNGVKTATVRAIITTKNLTSKGTTQATKVITLSYDYILAKASEENRFLNPLGFKVLTYRIDDEVAQ